MSSSVPTDDIVKGELVWSDEFDGDKLDESKWTREKLWAYYYNNERQEYTDSEDNSFVKDGFLNIEVIPGGDKNNDGLDYSSARLISKGQGDFQYGYFEIRASLPTFEGAWAAAWMLPTDPQFGAWPKSGEIDIIEYTSCYPGNVHGTVHTEAFNYMIGTDVTKMLELEAAANMTTFHEQFHTYQMYWTPDSIRLAVDDNWYYSFPRVSDDPKAWPFDTPFHLILNMAVGGWAADCLPNGGDGYEINFPVGQPQNRYVIDYVRVYDGGFSGANASRVVAAPRAPAESPMPVAAVAGLAAAAGAVFATLAAALVVRRARRRSPPPQQHSAAVDDIQL